jgi:diaminohydroxyphosphoribosylaminopyrimidine deaminase/5-amino-6-(5-phosphoribosylamino)uracil reductase
MPFDAHDGAMMRRALELARRGQGHVEPNPMVGCVIVAQGAVVGEGWHRAFGEAHAEVEALSAAGPRAAGATLYVTLEPCCHYGQTPPCTEAILRAGVRRVVAAMQDPFPLVDGSGLAALRGAGVTVEMGLCQDAARAVNAPFLKLIERHAPWIIAKWAMTLDGKIATASGESRWISGEASRRVVHELRGRVDAIMVGRKTAVLDDPLLVARPAGPRVATRVVLDSAASLPVGHQLVRTAREVDTLVAVGTAAPAERCQRLSEAGCEVFMGLSHDRTERLVELLEELAGRRMTNVLVEGGGELVGSLLDLGHVDEVHVLVAAKLVGGIGAPSPVAGRGRGALADAVGLVDPTVQQVGEDVYVHGRVRLAGGARSGE